MKKIHILGICGTFMGGIALLARESGVAVEGTDENVYPPMSTMLESQGVHIKQSFKPDHIEEDVDQVVVGNVMTRGKEIVEFTLNQAMAYTSGPQWLYENILKDRWVLAVAGTHGKTTTASMLTWILEYAGLKPGFLIGGVPENFGVSARLGESPFFVVEADEYDTAFFDKRSKFVHYRPRTVVLNNLEYDHADIFPDLEAIKTQFHHLIRMVPGEGLIVTNGSESELTNVLDKGCWTPQESFTSDDSIKDGDWSAEYIHQDGSEFNVLLKGKAQGTVCWNHIGKHNVANALAAIAAARHAGVPVKHCIEALSEFKGVKRRMQLRGAVGDIKVYDDFAHHPTAIQTTLEGLRASMGDEPITVILEPRSNTMRMGIHKDNIAPALSKADEVIMYQPENVEWGMEDVVSNLTSPGVIYRDIEAIIDHVVRQRDTCKHVLVMSNGGFGNIHDRLLGALEQTVAEV